MQGAEPCTHHILYTCLLPTPELVLPCRACVQYMEALVKCREQNPVRRYFGECNDMTWDLTK